VGQWDHIRECLLGGREDCSRAVLLYSVICLSFATAPASAVAPQLYWCLAEYGGIALSIHFADRRSSSGPSRTSTCSAVYVYCSSSPLNVSGGRIHVMDIDLSRHLGCKRQC
jgi:hypothetical protein